MPQTFHIIFIFCKFNLQYIFNYILKITDKNFRSDKKDLSGIRTEEQKSRIR